MISYYNLFTANIFVIYIFLRLFSLSSKKSILLMILALISLNFLFYDNMNIFYFVTGFINFFSISSFIFLIFIVLTTIINKKTTFFAYSSFAFLPICIIFYGLFFIISYKLYDIGFSAYLILIPIFIYGLILLVISNKFILFNIFIVIATISYFTKILQNNIWDYLLDPTLLIICIIEIYRYILLIRTNKKSKDKFIYY